MGFLKKAPTFSGILLMLIVWQLSAVAFNNRALFPTVFDLLHELYTLLLTAEFYLSLGLTLFRALIGFSIALILALVVSSLSLHRPFFKSFFQPWLVTIRAIPIIAVVLIAMLWLSPRHLPSFIAFFTMFPILYHHFLNGLENTDIKLLELAKVLKKSAWQRLLLLYFPSAKSQMVAGLSTAIGFGWRAVIIGEVLSVPLLGIGTNMKRAQAYIDIPQLMAWTTAAVMVSFLFEFALKKWNSRVKLNPLVYQPNKKNLSTQQNKNISISVKSLSVRFQNMTLLNQFSQHFRSGKVYLIKAPSGFGKTTLLRLIAGLHKSYGGIRDVDHQLSVGYLFQDLRLIPWLTAEENIAFAHPQYPIVPLSLREVIWEWAQKFGIAEHLKKFPSELSGGQQQRAALLRILISRHALLLLDEPMQGLDIDLKIAITAWIEQYQKETNCIVIWTTHEQPELYLQGAVHELVLPTPMYTSPNER